MQNTRNRLRTASLTLATSLVLCAAAPAQDFALELQAGSVLKFPHHPAMNTTQTTTIEAWARSLGSSSGGTFSLFQRYAGSAEHKQLYLGDDGVVRQIYAGSPWAQSGACLESAPGAFPVDGTWHHVAFVRHADSSWETYVDGVEVNSGTPGSCCWSTCGIINTSAETWVVGQLGWQLLRLRVSSTDLYDGAFTPAQCWDADPDTIFLLKLDEGAGAAVVDSSVNAQVGTIAGGYSWVAAAPLASSAYCTAGTSASGCTPALSSSGCASATSGSGFVVSATQVEGARNGVLLFGSNGRQSMPWGNGTSYLCVAPPVKRGGVMQAAGTRGQCDGVFAADLNAHWCPGCPRPAHNPGAGAVVQAQLWYRDPLSTSNQTTSLSSALEFTVDL